MTEHGQYPPQPYRQPEPAPEQGHQQWGPPPPQQGYQQWGPPPSPGPHPTWQQQPPPAEPKNGLGLAALILGLVGILFGLVPLTGFVAVGLGLTGAALGLAAFGRVRRGLATNRKTTYAGTGISVLAVAAGIWGIVITLNAVDQLGEDLEDLGGGQLTTEEAATGASSAVPAGQLVEVGDWRVAIQASNTDAAQAIAVENQFNDPPPAGEQFVMARADVAYAGAETGTPWLDLRFRVLGAGGNFFGTAENGCGVIPSSLSRAEEMVAGASAAGNVCISVPVDQLQGAVWVVEQTLSVDGDARAFVALQ